MLKQSLLIAMFLLAIGCDHFHSTRVVPPPGCQPVFSQYHHDQFRWSEVSRVLVLPFANDSEYTRCDEEIAKALRSELQQLGKFEVVMASPDDSARLSEKIHRSGRFSEDEMLQQAKIYHADVVIHGTITQYSPYPRPRIGIVLQAVSPMEGKVIASVDGLWDANHLPIAKRAQDYYLQRKKQLTPYHDANWIYPDDGHADELALLSPQLYQRWVCSELSAILVQDPMVTGMIVAPRGVRAVTPVDPRSLIPPPPPETNQPVNLPKQPSSSEPPKAPKSDPKIPYGKSDVVPSTETRYSPTP